MKIHMIPVNPFVIFNVYSYLTYDSCEPLCYLQCLFLFDIWFLWITLLSSLFIPQESCQRGINNTMAKRKRKMINIKKNTLYSKLRIEQHKPHYFHHYNTNHTIPIISNTCLFLFDISFLETPLLSSLFISLWHMNPVNPFAIFIVYY
jgi:hypothetical protein